MNPLVDESDEQMDYEDGQSTRADGHRLRHSYLAQDGQWFSSNHPSHTNWETSLTINEARPSTAPANLYNYGNEFSRPHDFQGHCPSTLSESTSRRSSPSSNSYDGTDDPSCMSLGADLLLSRTFSEQCSLSPAESTTHPSHGPSTDGQRRRSFARVAGCRHRQDQDKFRCHSTFSSPVRHDQQHQEDSFAGGSHIPGRIEGRRHRPPIYRRRHRLEGENTTHYPAPDHRRLVHHSFLGGYSSHSPTTPSIPQSRNFPIRQFCPRSSPPRSFWHGISRNSSPYRSRFVSQCGVTDTIYAGAEDPFFKPSRGDIVVVQPSQRGRMPNADEPGHQSGCVKSYTGNEADFDFRNGDLVVRIGSYAANPFAAVAYAPYTILEIYKRHDSIWKFQGDALAEEDLSEKRRNSCFERQFHAAMHVRIGETCNIEPNYGDILIRQDSLKNTIDEQQLAGSIINWWTASARESKRVVYPHGLILLRPYVRNRDFLQARENWLGRRVFRFNTTRDGNVDEGIVVKVWPESEINDGPSSFRRGTFDKLWDAPEVLGPDRVGVRVRNPGGGGEMEEKNVAWLLSNTFLENIDQPLSAYQSVEERTSFRNDPWGSIELYIYSRELPVGWVYWGRSQHICDTPYPATHSRI